MLNKFGLCPCKNSVLTFAAKNRTQYFLVLLKLNLFGGIEYEHVIVNIGCSSYLFPLPLHANEPEMGQFFPKMCFHWGSLAVVTGAKTILLSKLRIDSNLTLLSY